MTIQPITGILITIVLLLTLATMLIWHFLTKSGWRHHDSGKAIMPRPYVHQRCRRERLAKAAEEAAKNTPTSCPKFSTAPRPQQETRRTGLCGSNMKVAYPAQLWANGTGSTAPGSPPPLIRRP